MRTVNVGVIGVGAMGENHVRVYHKMEEANLIAVSDVSERALKKIEKKYGAKIQVGEFSVAIWAPGGADYLNDLISIFEEYKWDWTYHAFREWEGWSLEHEGTPDAIVKAQTPTDRLQTMLKYWQKNKK